MKKQSDGGGLQLRVKPNGTKSWLLDYFKPFTKKRTALGLGAYPEVSLAEARKKHVAARELLAKDINPKEHKDDKHREQVLAATNTLKSVAESWFAIKKQPLPKTPPKAYGASLKTT
ncbi:integrase arm-type DNA-binding domain-containing protein [Candidatus Colwellia aromaticivorans]|uniref:integrase arm-type DNA-binding domain-containing protein n=1 Tax=Candidatus Colwellia aromaticivorans TaxID=2267621 RepID=UPI001FE7E188|nr:integrase arm-type DNA-binding domain-containing protein [Candidatus Colwellia aromaticivorans]